MYVTISPYRGDLYAKADFHLIGQSEDINRLLTI